MVKILPQLVLCRFHFSFLFNFRFDRGRAWSNS